MTSSDRVGVGAALAALGAAALWGTTGTAQALGPVGSDPVQVGALRILVGAVALALLAGPLLWRGRGTRAVVRHGRRSPSGGPGPAARHLPVPVIVVAGGLAVAAYQACFFVGVDRTGVAVGTVVALGVAPPATGLLAMALGERVTATWVVSTVGAVTGVVLLVLGTSTGPGTTDALGLAASAGAGVSYAAYTVAARALLLRGESGIRVMALLFCVGALALAPALLRADLAWVWTGRGLAMVLWLGLVATALAYVLFQRGLAGLPAGTVATMSLAEPVTATVLGVVVLDERPGPLSVAGMAVVVVSLALVVAGGARRGRGSRPPAGAGFRSRGTRSAGDPRRRPRGSAARRPRGRG